MQSGAPRFLVGLDRYQRRHPWLGFPLAVFDKFVDDRGPHLAGLITYYGFLLRPHPLVARLRGSVVLVLLGVGLGVTTALSALTAVPVTDTVPTPLLSAPIAMLVNAALFLVAFRALTVRELTFRQVAPGAVLAALAWQLLELGAARSAASLTDADPLYGVFALVLAPLAWIYLEALVVVFAAEVNAVLVERLWPRALLTITHFVGPDDLTDADRRSLVSYARSQRYQSFERIDVAFNPDRLPSDR